jgi:cell wall-associated NlpC family hydrolase
MGALNRLVYIFEGKDALSPVGRKAAEKMGVYGKMAGSNFSSKMKAGLSTVGPMALSAIGVGLVYAVKEGLKVPMSQLKVALADAGSSFDAMKPKVDAASDRMVNLGFGMDETYQSIINMTRATGSGDVAIKSLGIAADLAKVKHVGLADASMLLAKAADGSLKALKGMNIAIASGSSNSQAMESAQKTLAERISVAGGMAKFAAQHNMSMAQAQKLVTSAMDGAQVAMGKLADHDLSLAHATTLVKAAAQGSGDAMKNLKDHGLTLNEAQKLVEQSSKGNIDAFNQLGIAVLPKTATAAQRLAQIQTVLNKRIGGTAVAASKTFAGKLNIIKVRFQDIAAKVGLFILPYLSTFASVLQKILGNKAGLMIFAAAIGTIAIAFIAVKVAAMYAFVAENLATFGIIAGIMAAIAVIIIIIKNWDKVKKVVMIVWKWIHDHPFIALLIPIIGILLVIATHWRALWKVIEKVWDNVRHAAGNVFNFLKKSMGVFKNIAIAAFRAAWNVISQVFGNILHAAAVAFGWVPKLGDKLKKADKAFQNFRKRVNAELDNINNKKVHVGVDFSSAISGAPGHEIGHHRHMGNAAGGPIKGPGGDRSDRAGVFALSNNEYVMQASAHKTYGTGVMNAVNQGRAAIIPMAAGGATGVTVQVDTPSSKSMSDSMDNPIRKMAVAWAKSMMGSGPAIVRFARKYIGGTPYVWGGDSPGGWDCSGFISFLYRHFGLMTGRNTAEGFRGWGKKVGSPVPGGMTFFGNPAFHIALTTGGNRTLEAGGGFHTPTWGTTAGNSGFAIPPHGFYRGRSGGGGRWGNSELGALWARHGGSNKRVAAAIAMSESGGIPNRVQQGMPPGLTGWGLWQITPTSGIWQNGRFGNLLNAENNARAAVYLWRQAGGFRPWAVYNTGAYQRFMAQGGPVQSFDGGGMLRPGYTLAYNGTGRSEPVGAGPTIVINAGAILGTKREVARYVSDALAEFENHGGRVRR